MSKVNKIVVILGQTASGKTDLALRVAQQYDGEIVCADSRTVYKGMDIGTAKPTLAEQGTAVHHGLDLIEPSESFSAAEFKDYATAAIASIQTHNKLPIIVGGSGLYIDSYVYNFSFADKPDPLLRAQLDSLTMMQLKQRATDLGVSDNDVDFKNRRHLTRMVERVLGGEWSSSRSEKPDNILLIGLQVSREQLVERITNRVNKMFNEGLVYEVQALVAEYGADAPGLLAPGYKAVIEHIDGRLTLEESKELFIRYDKKLAKRQRTWFQRNPDIVWCKTSKEAEENISAFLQ